MKITIPLMLAIYTVIVGVILTVCIGYYPDTFAPSNPGSQLQSAAVVSFWMIAIVGSLFAAIYLSVIIEEKMQPWIKKNFW